MMQTEEYKEYVKKWEIEQEEKKTKEDFLHHVLHEIINPKGYYVYFHITIGLYKEVFYVGKGKDNRGFEYNNRSKEWKEYIKGKNYQVFILKDNLTEQEALDLEKKYIEKIGRKDLGKGSLVNLTGGGYGISEGAYQRSQSRKLKEKQDKFEALKKLGYRDPKGLSGYVHEVRPIS